MTKSKVTPLQAARAWAAEHPDFEGEVRVTTTRTRAGGRWGWRSSTPTQQTSRVWVAGGRAALNKSLRGKNGPCYACGQIVLEPVLRDAYRRDERAGQPIGAADRAATNEWVYPADTPCFYADWCGVREICPTCIESLGLEAILKPFQNWKHGEPRPIICEPAEFVAPNRKPLVVHIDLTKSETAGE